MVDVEMTDASAAASTPLPAELTSLIHTLLETADDAAAARSAGQSTSAQFTTSAAALAQLKALNRSSGVEFRRGRQLAADAKQRMDTAQLGLQNLLYERQYLEREIRKCEEYQCARPCPKGRSSPLSRAQIRIPECAAAERRGLH
jgi:THO complex subunit 5